MSMSTAECTLTGSRMWRLKRVACNIPTATVLAYLGAGFRCVARYLDMDVLVVAGEHRPVLDTTPPGKLWRGEAKKWFEQGPARKVSDVVMVHVVRLGEERMRVDKMETAAALLRDIAFPLNEAKRVFLLGHAEEKKKKHLRHVPKAALFFVQMNSEAAAEGCLGQRWDAAPCSSFPDVYVHVHQLSSTTYNLAAKSVCCCNVEDGVIILTQSSVPDQGNLPTRATAGKKSPPSVHAVPALQPPTAHQLGFCPAPMPARPLDPALLGALPAAALDPLEALAYEAVDYGAYVPPHLTLPPGFCPGPPEGLAESAVEDDEDDEGPPPLLEGDESPALEAEDCEADDGANDLRVRLPSQEMVECGAYGMPPLPPGFCPGPPEGLAESAFEDDEDDEGPPPLLEGGESPVLEAEDCEADDGANDLRVRLPSADMSVGSSVEETWFSSCDIEAERMERRGVGMSSVGTSPCSPLYYVPLEKNLLRMSPPLGPLGSLATGW